MQTTSPPNHPASFGAWLRERRQELGLTQGALAERAGCARDVLRQFESGAKRPSPRLAARLADVLGIEAERSAFVAAARAVGPRAPRQPQPAAPPPFSATKLQPPRPRGDLLPRPRLSDELRAAIGSIGLVLISAPPGAGKTTLITQTLVERTRDEAGESGPDGPAAASLRFGWLTLDEDDNDLARFLSALAWAVAAIAPEAAAQARAALAAGLQAAAPPTALGRQVAGTLAGALLGALTGPAALVLDDLHAIVDPAALAALDYLIDQLPPALTVVLATRHDPPLALARRRARRELLELRMDDLRLTIDEAATLLNEHRGLSLPPAQLAALHAQTEGWAAGVGLLAASLERIAAPADRERFLSGLAHVDRYLFDYLAEEVLNRQDPFVRMFLLETAILQDLAPQVCATVTGREDAGQILDDLYRRNLFLVEIGNAAPSAGPEPVYRYHMIFRDFLRERLRREAPEWLRGLHRRAARAERHPARQIHHLLAAEDWAAAAARIAAVAEQYAEQGAVMILRGWINGLPDDLRDGDPWMLYWQGVCAYRELELEVAQGLFARALAGFEASGDRAGEGEALVQSLILSAAWSDLPRAEALAERALACPLPPHRRGRLLVARAQGRATHGRWDQANTDLDAAIELAGAPGADPRVAIDVAEGFRGVFSTLPGGVGRFERLARLLRPLAREPDSLPRLDLLELQMYVGLWRGRWDDALNAATELYAIGERLGIVGWARITAAWVPALCGAIRGDEALAARYGPLLLPPTGEDLSALNAGVNTLLVAWYGRMQWVAGNPEGLRVAEDLLRSIAARNPAEWIRVVHATLRGLLLIGERRFGEAETLLRQAADLQERMHITLLSSSARLLLAHLLLSTQRPDAALAAMLPQLRLHAAQDTPGFLMWEGRPVAVPLLRLAIERGEEPDFAARTLRLLGEEADAVAVAPATGGLLVPATGETLTAREVEVLQLLARGMSNQAIADRLIISLHTAKRHVANILQKLDAASRTEAAARARDLGVA